MKIYAHKKYVSNNCVYETLDEHIQRVLKYAGNYFDILDKIIKTIFKKEEVSNFIYNATIDTIKMHDDGKKNPYFQYKKMDNVQFKRYSNGQTQHSILSSILYLYKYLPLAGDFEDYNKLGTVIFYYAFLISRHHSYLKDFDYEEFLEEIYSFSDERFFVNTDFDIEWLDELERILPVKDYISIDNEIYVLCKILYSILCYSDFLATREFMGFENYESNKLTSLQETYENTDLLKNIRNGMSNSEINIERTKIFLESENTYKQNLTENFYYLNAPCGAGKTNILTNLIFQGAALNNRKIAIFTFPFNTIIEQTSDLLGNYLVKGKDYMTINSISSMVKDEEDTYDMVYHNYQFLNYPILVTSHVKLFNILFGTDKQDLMCLIRLSHSIICLDELQGYGNLWMEMSELLSIYAKLLDIQFILSSATLPKIGVFKKEDRYIDLLKTNYHQCHIFKDRVLIKYDLMESNEDEIYNKIKNTSLSGGKILVRFIKKKSAKEFFNKIKSNVPNTYLITGDDSKKKKKEIIDISKNNKNILLVSTQVIEAGCDIDFDIGFFDTGLIDTDEQVCGRIARNAKRQGIVYFFNLDDAKKIYRDDIRKEFTINDERYRNIIVNKDFENYYLEVFSILKEHKNSYKKDSLIYFFNNLKNIQFEKISESMKLINTNTIHIILLSDEKAEELKDKYKYLLSSNLDYSEKMVKLSKLKEDMDDYSMNIYPWQISKEYDVVDEIFGIKFVRANELESSII